MGMKKYAVVVSSFAFLCSLALISKSYNMFPKAVFENDFSQDSRNLEMARENKQKEKCEPVLSIVYLKMHKTGSTTLKKILDAHVKRHQKGTPAALKLPFPYFGGFPGRFKKRFACYEGSLICGPKETRGTARRPINLLIGHLRFDKDEIRSLMDSKAKYVTMMRDPYSQFESSFNYYYARYKEFPSKRLMAACHPEPYLQVTKRFGVGYSEYLQMAKTSLNQSVAWYFRSTNVQSFELGLDPLNDDEDHIIAKAQELDATFDLVALMEYYVESIVLLKDILCMSWEDAALLHERVQNGSYEKHVLTETDKEIIRSLNKQDLILYDYFNKSFWRKVDEYGRSRMEMDSAELRRHVVLSQTQQTSTSQKLKKQNLNGNEKARSKAPNENMSGFTTRDKRMGRLVQAIWQKSKLDLDPNLVGELASYMYNHQGWCPT